ncbi:MAG: FAD/NAD(P)-binding protein [Gammaproteobacteria bacterium]|nr:FAD/NAD(P)-binding protein [Gammaproteobacteria bacterium]
MSTAAATLAAASAAPDPMAPRAFVVRERAADTADTFTLHLEAEDGEDLEFAPGQFNMLYAFGAGESAISISGDPAAPERLVHTVRAVGTVTRALEGLAPGDVLGVRGPYGSAWPIEAARGRDIVFIAGGIGLAPLRPAIYHVLTSREDYGRVTIIYGARMPDDVLYRREIESWSARLDVEVYATVDRAAAGWYGNVGVVTHLVRRAGFDPANATAMLCGPEIMMRYCAVELAGCGMTNENVYVSLERNMKCALGFCGHCQYGPAFICRDGPVFDFARAAPWFDVREL